MKKILVLSLLSLICNNAFASFALHCDHTSSLATSYKLTITSKKLSLKKIGPSEKISVWNLKEAGLYSYMGDSASVLSNGNIQSIDWIRFDIENGKKLEQLDLNQPLKAELTIGWYDFTIDHSGVYQGKEKIQLVCRAREF